MKLEVFAEDFEEENIRSKKAGAVVGSQRALGQSAWRSGRILPEMVKSQRLAEDLLQGILTRLMQRLQPIEEDKDSAPAAPAKTLGGPDQSGDIFIGTKTLEGGNPQQSRIIFNLQLLRFPSSSRLLLSVFHECLVRKKQVLRANILLFRFMLVWAKTLVSANCF